MKYVRSFLSWFLFSIYYVRSLIGANIRIAWDVLTPGLQIQPGFIAIPLRTSSDAETLFFSNLVTMTPGTLSLEVSPDRKFIYVHALYLQDIEKVRNKISEDLQSRVLQVVKSWK